MSRNLPEHPNLEYLKKEAKQLLRKLRQGNPDSKLADAQHSIAREYGVASWPKLRAYVESLSPHALAGPERGIALDTPLSAGWNPFIDVWTMNLSKSKLHPLQELSSATLEFAVTGSTVTIVDVLVDSRGELRNENKLKADGREHRSDQDPRYSVVARWLNSTVLEAVAKRDGKVEGVVTYEVSSDGNTLTVSARGEDSFDQVSVFDRCSF